MNEYPHQYPYARLPEDKLYDIVIFADFKSDVDSWEGMFLSKKSLLGETHLEDVRWKNLRKQKRGCLFL